MRNFFFHYQDEEDVKAIARLFADMGDSYVDLIATGNTSWMIMIKILHISVVPVWICLVKLSMNRDHPDHLSIVPAYDTLQVQVMPCK